jgi:hypothetical protein
MKKYLLILTLLLGSFSMAFAQDQPGDDLTKQEKIQSLYVAYVTQQLQLTPDEAQKFWPLHTQFESELKSVKNDLPELDKQQARLNIKKKYQESFTKILGANRCERFIRIDGEFKRKLLDRVQKQGNNPQRQRPIRRN